MSQSERYVAWKNAGGIQGALGGGLLFFFLPMGVYASGSHWPIPFVLLFPLGGIVGYAFGKTFGYLLLTGSGRVAQSFTLPATTGHYARGHSNIDTLEIRGDFKGAVAAWEAVSVAEPGNPWPLVRAGELYARELGDPETAIQRFRLHVRCPDDDLPYAPPPRWSTHAPFRDRARRPRRVTREQVAVRPHHARHHHRRRRRDRDDRAWQRGATVRAGPHREPRHDAPAGESSARQRSRRLRSIRSRRCGSSSARRYSTVTLFARLRG